MEDLMNKEREKINEKECEEEINYELLNQASKYAMAQGEEWDDLSWVNNMMIEVIMEQEKENNVSKRKRIEAITEMYKLQKEQLIESMVKCEEKLLKEGKIKYNKETGELEIIDDKILDT